MNRSLRLAALRLARLAGLFALARRLTARRLRILAYHGASLRDEHKFRPGLFMTGGTFEQRMQWLRREGYHVLPLGDALRRLDDGSLPPGATVITIDDGWYGTFAVMAPVLGSLGLPATLYVTTYYLMKQTQVFNVAAAYVLWAARDRTVDLGGVVPGFAAGVDLGGEETRGAIVRALEAHAETLAGAPERQALWRRLCVAVGVDPAPIEEQRLLAFMRPEEARALPGKGVELQLHTHRHRFPAGAFADAEREIRENREFLAGIAVGSLSHFCYPSGHYQTAQLPWLPRLGIASAVTTTPGLNRASTPRGELRRILDSEALSPLEFEAEMCGFRDLFRRA